MLADASNSTCFEAYGLLLMAADVPMGGLPGQGSAATCWSSMDASATSAQLCCALVQAEGICTRIYCVMDKQQPPTTRMAICKQDCAVQGAGWDTCALDVQQGSREAGKLSMCTGCVHDEWYPVACTGLRCLACCGQQWHQCMCMALQQVVAWPCMWVAA